MFFNVIDARYKHEVVCPYFKYRRVEDYVVQYNKVSVQMSQASKVFKYLIECVSVVESGTINQLSYIVTC